MPPTMPRFVRDLITRIRASCAASSSMARTDAPFDALSTMSHSQCDHVCAITLASVARKISGGGSWTGVSTEIEMLAPKGSTVCLRATRSCSQVSYSFQPLACPVEVGRLRMRRAIERRLMTLLGETPTEAPA